MKKLMIIGALLCASIVPYSVNAALVNLATAGTASQSSTGWGGVANRAIDGDTNGNYWGGSVSHTLYNKGAWWTVDLGTVNNIQQIDIWNRTDCCANRLTNFTVSVLNSTFNSVWSQVFSGTASTHEIFNVIGGINGQFVKVQLNGTNYLQLAEVQVFGSPSAVPVPAAVWLMGSGLLGLMGFSRKNKKLAA